MNKKKINLIEKDKKKEVVLPRFEKMTNRLNKKWIKTFYSNITWNELKIFWVFEKIYDKFDKFQKKNNQ